MDGMSMIGGLGSGLWEVPTAEMKRYEYQIGPTGQISYAAPSGYHDDCVMALALAVWGCSTFGVEPSVYPEQVEGRTPRGGVPTRNGSPFNLLKRAVED